MSKITWPARSSEYPYGDGGWVDAMYRTLASEHCPFRTRPSIGDLIVSDEGIVPIPGNKHPYRDNDRARLERLGHVKLANKGKRKHEWGESYAYCVMAVDDWWDDHRPLTEPDYSI